MEQEESTPWDSKWTDGIEFGSSVIRRAHESLTQFYMDDMYDTMLAYCSTGDDYTCNESLDTKIALVKQVLGLDWKEYQDEVWEKMSVPFSGVLGSICLGSVPSKYLERVFAEADRETLEKWVLANPCEKEREAFGEIRVREIPYEATAKQIVYTACDLFYLDDSKCQLLYSIARECTLPLADLVGVL